MMRALFLAGILFLAGCAHSIHESHTSDFEGIKPGAQVVEATGEQLSIMGFSTETNYANRAFDSLKAKCPGRITGITTKYWTSLGFFSWTNKVKMTGYCI